MLNSPALKFDHALDLDRLHQATAALLLEYPIIGGRYVQHMLIMSCHRTYVLCLTTCQPDSVMP
jgi:hypothetical protein